MACQGNENCPYNEDDSNKRLDKRLDALEAKLNAMLGYQNNKKTGSNPVSPQVTSPDPKKDESKDESKSRRAWLYAITDIFNNLTKLVPTILKSKRGLPGLFSYNGFVVGGICAILIAIPLTKGTTNNEGLRMIYNLGLLSIVSALIGYLVWVIRDPDRPGGGGKQVPGSGKKKKKQQDPGNNIDKSENDDDMKDSLNSLEPIIEQMTVFDPSVGSGSFYIKKSLTDELNEERSCITILCFNDIEKVASIDTYSEYLKLRMSFLLHFMVPVMDIEILYLKIMQMEVLFSLSHKKYKIDKMINSKIIDMFNESDRVGNLRSFLILYRRGLYHPVVNEQKLNLPEMRIEKEIINLDDYRSSSGFDKIFKTFYNKAIRKFAKEMNSQRNIKMSRKRKIDLNYAIDDSSQFYKEKKKIYPTITHNYLFHIPEIKRLSQTSTVTPLTNVPLNIFSFALQTKKRSITIPIDQKIKDNKLLRKKIKLNLN